MGAEGLGCDVDEVAEGGGAGEIELEEALFDGFADEVEVGGEGEEGEELVGEGEDGDAVAGEELGEGGAGAGGAGGGAGLHAAADVPEAEEVEGDFIAGEVADGLGLTVVGDEEVFGAEGFGVAGLSGDVDIDADEADAAAEQRLRVLGGEDGRREKAEKRQGPGH